MRPIISPEEREYLKQNHDFNKRTFKIVSILLYTAICISGFVIYGIIQLIETINK